MLASRKDQMRTTDEIRREIQAETDRIKALGKPVLIPQSRRFQGDRPHVYGWEVAFVQSFRFPDGQISRMAFHDIGTDRRAAIANAYRALDTAYTHHPAVEAVWDELQARELVVAPFKAKVSQWRRGWFDWPNKVSNSLSSFTKLQAKFHAMRRAAEDTKKRPSRSMCTGLASDVVSKRVPYDFAVNMIVNAGGKMQ